MENVVSDVFGCKVIERENTLFIQYDHGGSASWLVESEITKDEAKKAVLAKKRLLT